MVDQNDVAIFLLCPNNPYCGGIGKEQSTSTLLRPAPSLSEKTHTTFSGKYFNAAGILVLRGNSSGTEQGQVFSA